ncbi:hypothetical protein PPERSA_01537 [Pseudocohnilembus persalinus]|uniref:Uncharacterized protein n=1 Tax=Pseudocohnilembus persalinus TaxID=266149 RepID=A0A0V0R7N9_PSEPJ|nr:hypothetical protein PPERSA_01537 [Pseudocohnilembus persalinus]|eukprot:KRX10525.1 hypothetical protein PPERSA_01537 [Pseudocohnilembus persalinus]
MGTCTSKSHTNKQPISIKKGNPQQAVPSMRTQTYVELEVPENVDTKGYEKTFDKFSNLMELLGDVTRLPQRTLQFVKKLFEAKKKVDESTLESFKEVYHLFDNYSKDLDKILQTQQGNNDQLNNAQNNDDNNNKNKNNNYNNNNQNNTTQDNKGDQNKDTNKKSQTRIAQHKNSPYQSNPADSSHSIGHKETALSKQDKNSSSFAEKQKQQKKQQNEKNGGKQ